MAWEGDTSPGRRTSPPFPTKHHPPKPSPDSRSLSFFLYSLDDEITRIAKLLAFFSRLGWGIRRLGANGLWVARAELDLKHW